MLQRVNESTRPWRAAEAGVMHSLPCACKLAGRGVSGKTAQLLRWQAHAPCLW